MNLTDEEFSVLNAVYLRKMVTVEAIEDITGLEPASIGDVVARLVDRGLVADVGGGHCMLEQPAGVSAAIAAYDERYADLRSSEEVMAWHERFEVLNAQFLQVISAWQTSGEEESALDKVLKLVDRQIKALSSFTSVPRYRRYADRLSAAVEKVEQGQTEYVTSLSIDSIHNAWFELHEDILTVIGRPRDVAEQERSG